MPWKLLSQWLHWYGFSPVCLLKWTITVWESLLTMAALIWFLISVCPQMNCKLTILWGNHVTMAAMVRLLPSVSSYEIKADYYASKLFTLAANIWLACFFPLCFLRWLISWPLCEKALSQWLHWYGFSPVGVLMWITKLLFTKKTLSQWLHWYVFFPVCLRMPCKLTTV